MNSIEKSRHENPLPKELPAVITALLARITERVGIPRIDTRTRVADIYAQKFGPQTYRVTEAPETSMAEWQKEIDALFQALREGHRQKIESLLGRASDLVPIDKTMDLLAKEISSEEDLQLLAIGIFILREKSKWKGKLKAIIKVYLGGQYPLESALTKEGNATCLDIALLINQLAQQRGIPGSVCRIGKSQLVHRIWVSKSGKVMDPMYGATRAGFFGTREQHAREIQSNPFLDAAWINYSPTPEPHA